MLPIITQVARDEKMRWLGHVGNTNELEWLLREKEDGLKLDEIEMATKDSRKWEKGIGEGQDKIEENI